MVRASIVQVWCQSGTLPNPVHAYYVCGVTRQEDRGIILASLTVELSDLHKDQLIYL